MYANKEQSSGMSPKLSKHQTPTPGRAHSKSLRTHKYCKAVRVDQLAGRDPVSCLATRSLQSNMWGGDVPRQTMFPAVFSETIMNLSILSSDLDRTCQM